MNQRVVLPKRRVSPRQARSFCFYGLEVFVDQSLTEYEEIFFQAGNHLRVMKLRYQDFADLVHPKVTNFHLTAGIRGN